MKPQPESTPTPTGTELLWLNGKVMPLADGRVGIEDRGFQFADGVYETLRVYNGVAFALDRHLARLDRSCQGIDLPPVPNRANLPDEIRALIHRSGIQGGSLYLQVTRGQAPRNALFPAVGPTVLFYTRPLPPAPPPGSAPKISIHAVQDIRWRRCWIKSIALLPNILARNQAAAVGADEVAFVEDGIVHEAGSANLMAVIKGALVTPPVGEKVLPGITRDVLLEIARAANIPTVERPLSLTETLAADELFITGSIREVVPVAYWDGRPINPPGPAWGPIALKLHQGMHRQIDQEIAAARANKPR